MNNLRRYEFEIGNEGEQERYWSVELFASKDAFGNEHVKGYFASGRRGETRAYFQERIYAGMNEAVKAAHSYIKQAEEKNS